MSTQTDHWLDNLTEVRRFWPQMRPARARRRADLWTITDGQFDLLSVNPNRWSQSTKDALYTAREAVRVLQTAMRYEEENR